VLSEDAVGTAYKKLMREEKEAKNRGKFFFLPTP